jgi:hypothetical protein
MKKLSSTVSHMAVIGLALLALIIATLVWLFERARGNHERPLAETPDEAAVSVTAILKGDAPEPPATLGREGEAAGDSINL